MALARVVQFEDVDSDHMRKLKQDVEGGERPEGLPATELLILHDPEAQKSVAIMFFDNEDDFQQGNAVMDAMPTSDTPGRRVSVGKYEVAVRVTA